MADNINPTAATAANDIADIITTGRARAEDPNDILEKIWDTASVWIPDDPLDGAPDHLVAEATEFMRDATWTYAKTMPDNPHWYVVETKLDDPRVGALKELLRHHSHLRRWHGHAYRALDLDGWSIWDLWPVINRKPIEVAGWDGDPAPPTNWLADEFRRDLAGNEIIVDPGFEVVAPG